MVLYAFRQHTGLPRRRATIPRIDAFAFTMPSLSATPPPPPRPTAPEPVGSSSMNSSSMGSSSMGTSQSKSANVSSGAFDSPIERPSATYNSTSGKNLYGAASRARHGKRAAPPVGAPRSSANSPDGECSGCGMSDSEDEGSRAKQPGTGRIAYLEWRGSFLTSASLQSLFFGVGHKCTTQTNGQCCHEGLWGAPDIALDNIRKHRASLQCVAALCALAHEWYHTRVGMSS